MQKYQDNMFARGLSFFGRSNRLISHELKNVLAIISETTSLLDELIELSGEGTRLEPGKLRSLAGSILEDIDRANKVIRTMNAFAHGVDTLYGEADVGRAINVMQNIARMNAAAKKARLVFPDPEPHTIFTIPFILQNLLYETLTGVMSGATAEIRLVLNGTHDGVTIRMEGVNPEFGQQWIEEKAAFYEKNLNADLHFDRAAKVMTITLPARIEERNVE